MALKETVKKSKCDLKIFRQQGDQGINLKRAFP
jgi:hypothetical protein